MRHQIFLFAATMFLSVDSAVALAEPLINANTRFPDLAEQTLAQTPRRQRNQQVRRDRLMDKLNLTDAQKQRLEEIRQKYQGQMSQLRNSLRAAHQELRTMMAGNDSANTIRDQHQEVVRLGQTLGNLRFESMLEMREVLTPQQRSQFAQIMEQRRGKLRDRMGNPLNDQEQEF